MAWDSKVLWTEGLVLQPHHFQQSDRYTESLVAGLARRVSPYVWGVNKLEIDQEVLKFGQFAITSCSGLTPDGTVFRVPEAEDHPPALDVPEGIKDCVIYLTVPQRRQGALEVDMTGAELSAARLRPGELEITDVTSSGKKAVTMGVGKLRLQFALGVDDLADRLCIPIAKIIEVKPDKEVLLDKGFIPSAGVVQEFDPPGGLGVRLDTHCHAGYRIPPNYDSMIGKLIVHRKPREAAMATLLAALNEFHISPTKTTIPLHIRLLKNGNFRKSDVDINFVERLLGL